MATYPPIESEYPTNESKMGDVSRPISDIRHALR